MPSFVYMSLYFVLEGLVEVIANNTFQNITGDIISKNIDFNILN